MKKVGVRVPQWLGDAVVSTVFIREVKKTEAPCEITVVCPPNLASLFSHHPDVAGVMVLSYVQGKNIWHVGQDYRAQHFDVLYVLPQSFRTALEAWLSRTPLTVGFRSGLGRFVFKRSVPYEKNLLYAQRHLKLINKETLSRPELRPFFPTHPLSDSHPLFKPLQSLRRPILGIAPCSVAPARTWFADRFKVVAQTFINKTQGSVIFFGSPNEASIVKIIAKHIAGPVVDTSGLLSLGELGTVIKSCQVFLGNDSGLMHVASAFAVPSVIVFGPSRPEWALPPGGESVAKHYKGLFCVPCEQNECVRFGSKKYECLNLISTDEVIQDVLNYVENKM